MLREGLKMQFIKPMLAKPGKLPANDNQYSFEIKWDGMRAVLYYIAEQIIVISRNQNDITSQYPEFQQLGNILTGQQVILDGEIVALNKSGHPSFSLLQQRMGLTSPGIIKNKMHEVPVTYIIFDILQLNNISLLGLPYTERRDMLDTLHLVGPNWQTLAYQL
jgi:bifunctional non-homologous end joining protein LigD